MKRPQGFVPPEPPQADGEREQTSGSERSQQAKPKRRQRGGVSAHDAATEPITIIREPDAGAAPASRVAASAAQPDAADAERTAEKRLRKAERQRRRYERFEVRRFTQASRRRRLVWLGSVGGVVALAMVTTGVAFSPLMALRTITVEGANRVPSEQIVAALGSQLGTPLPLVDFEEIRAELAPFTLLQSYSTETRPPSTLVVRVVERTPLGSLSTGAGFTLVDAAGVVILESVDRQPGYPLIEANGPNPKLSFNAATNVIRALPAEMRAQLDVVSAKSGDSVTLKLAGGQNVVWGSAENSAIKAVVLAERMTAVDPDSVDEYDVSSPNAPVYR